VSEILPLVLASCVVALGALIQGSIGFGLSLFSVPFLLWIDAAFVPGPLLLGGVVLTVGMTVRERHAIDLPGLGWSTCGRVGGTVVGALALWALPSSELTLGAAALVLLGVAMSVSGLHLRPTSPTLVVAGVLSGFMGTTATIGGPPLALAYQHAAGDRLRSTMGGNLLLGAVISLVAIAAVGRFGWRELGFAAALVPGAMLGFALSGRVRHWVDAGWARPAVLTISALGALAVLAREL
jgi:uncharacterized membrane protein YfcA